MCVLPPPPNSFFSPQVCEWKEPEELRELLDLELPSRGERPEKLLERCRAVIRHSVRTGQHPAHQFGPRPVPVQPSWFWFEPQLVPVWHQPVPVQPQLVQIESSLSLVWPRLVPV